MGLRCTDLCWLQEFNNSEIVEEDNDEGLFDYKRDNDEINSLSFFMCCTKFYYFSK